MLDYVYVIGNDSGRIRCAEGHLVDEWATKSLGAGMDCYYVYRGVLYREDRAQPSTTQRAPANPNVIAGKFTYPQPAVTATPVPISVRVNVYTNCNRCPSTGVTAQMWGDEPDYPFVEYDLTFDRGHLVKVEAVP